MGQNLVWNSFSINPLCESNYIRIGRGHVDLVWNDLILTCNYCGIVDYHGKKQYNYYWYECVILACGPNLQLTAVKGTHVNRLYAKYEANKNIRFFEN